MLDQVRVQEVTLVIVKGDQLIQDKAQIEEVRILGCLWYLQTWRLKPQ